MTLDKIIPRFYVDHIDDPLSSNKIKFIESITKGYIGYLGYISGISKFIIKKIYEIENNDLIKKDQYSIFIKPKKEIEIEFNASELDIESFDKIVCGSIPQKHQDITLTILYDDIEDPLYFEEIYLFKKQNISSFRIVIKNNSSNNPVEQDYFCLLYQ